MTDTAEQSHRKRELADAVCGVIAARGIRGTTVRAVAREGGWTTGVLTHYFADKTEMLNFACEAWMNRYHIEFLSAIGRRRGLSALRALLSSDLTADEPESERGTRIWLSLIEEAARNGALAGNWRGLYSAYVSECEEHIREAIEDGEVADSCDVATCSTALIAAVDGINIRRILDPHEFTLAVQRRALEQALALLPRPLA
ncbi:MAG: TetR/AcrR family transcriptional regulator [Actinomycetes bacterium]